jgi:putative nucleotidyltransferase with HDIG domain
MSKKDNVLAFPSLVTQVTLANLTQEVERLKNLEKEICEMAARTILKALNEKDNYTYGHSLRVAYFSLVIGKNLELSDQEMYDLEMAALFHDIGKIGIPDKVLLKSSRLDEDEFLIMKEHPSKSAKILEGFKHFEKVAVYAKHHHERYDGRGYPDKLAGEDIPLFSRIILIADTFDAMTSSRPYRKGLEHEIAFEELLEFSGSQFDANLVKNFIEGMKKEQQDGNEYFYLGILDEKLKKNAA